MTREILFREGDSLVDGYCNGCNEHATPKGTSEHCVWVLQARGASLRFCDDCRVELALQIAERTLASSPPKAREKAFKIHDDDARKLIGPAPYVPWGLVKEHEARALKTHDQDIATLHRRGGLSLAELVAVIEDRAWKSMDTMTALAALARHIAEYEKRKGRA